MNKKTIEEKARILRLKQEKKERGERASDERWTTFLDNWCDEVEKRKPKEKEILDYCEFNGKKFWFSKTQTQTVEHQ